MLAEKFTAMSIATDLGLLLFPNYCSVCNRNLMHYEKAICLHCQSRLPRLRICDETDNTVEKVFWGRVPLESATALLKMPRNGVAHRLIHRLKYHNDKEVGERLGAMLGHEMQQSARMREFDYIIPVPLHPKKMHLRGYNQCDCIAKGISEVIDAGVLYGNLTRVQHTTSQTRRGRLSRWNNVKDIFWVKQPELIENSRVLLVDDVITTGATIEACANALLKVNGIKLSVAALAIPS
jgi:ComF family protein